MQATFPLELNHSWPLFEQEQRFDLGFMDVDGAFDRAFSPISAEDCDAAARNGVGRWSCDLTNGNRLTWSDTVFDIFGLPHGAALDRDETASFYTESSRAVMERLRAHAIRYRRGFVFDARINGGDGARRWMRLIAAPICKGARVTALHGLKLDVSATYR